MDEGGAPPADGANRIGAIAIGRRVRNVAVWTIALFIAFVPAALIGGGHEGGDPLNAVAAGRVLALAFGVAGLLASILSFALAFRHWEVLPLGTRWLASLPLLVIVFLIALSMLVVATG